MMGDLRKPLWNAYGAAAGNLLKFHWIQNAFHKLIRQRA
jgi:hypothetical protein